MKEREQQQQGRKSAHKESKMSAVSCWLAVPERHTRSLYELMFKWLNHEGIACPGDPVGTKIGLQCGTSIKGARKM